MTRENLDDTRMSVIAHLDELRTRLKYALIAVVVSAIVTYIFSERLFALLARPLVVAWTRAGLGAPSLHFSNPIEPFFTYLKLSLVAGLFLAAPVLFYQLWRFIAPGLYATERRYALAFAIVSAVFFMGGAAFGYFVVFPYGFQFFLGFANADVASMQQALGKAAEVATSGKLAIEPTLMMGEYFGLVWRLLLAFGLVFELPLLIFFLAVAGVVSYGALWRFNRYFVVLAFFISAALTPPDVVTQLFMALPLVVLYNLSVLLAFFVQRRRKARGDDEDDGEPEEAEVEDPLPAEDAPSEEAEPGEADPR